MKKSKLIMSVALLCLALAVLCFGVYAVQTVNYSLSGNITYEITDAFVEINTKVYSSSTFMEQSELYNKIDEVLAGTYTGLTEESVNIPTYNSTDKDAISEKDLDISFVGGETPKLAFFVVVNIKNLSDTAVWANVNNPSLPNNVYQVNSGLQAEITTNKNVVIALSLENQYKGVSSTSYTLNIQVGVDNNPISNFDFNTTNQQISLKAGANPTGALVIPSYINGTRVTQVGSFAGANATSIYVPTSVEQMSRYCFADCKKLTELSLPFTGAKNYATLEEAVNDPNDFGVDYPLHIYNYFGNDTYYTDNSLTVDNNLLYQYASDCDHGYMPKSLITINLLYGCMAIDRAFYVEETDNFIQEINLPNSLTSIGESTFYFCTSLTSITIPSSVIRIGRFAFSCCTGLTSITISNSITSIGGSAFEDCTGLLYTDTVNNLKYIKTTDNNYFALYGTVDPNLTSYTINNNCKVILDNAFQNCTNLTSITIPSTVTNIGSHAFDGCTGLTSITIPRSVTSIEYGAFQYCSGLLYTDTVNNLKYIKTTDNNYFAIYDTVDRNLTSCTINENCKFILNSAFQSCKQLTSITIPESVICIGSQAFYGCTGLISITIPSSVKSMGYLVFGDWTASQTIHVPFAEGNTPSGWDRDWNHNCNANIIYA